MELLIENIKTASDKKLFIDLATRLGLKTTLLHSEKEETAFLVAMKEGKKSGKVSEKKVMEALAKWK